MKKHLYVYGAMIIIFIIYNQFFQTADERANALINILFASFLFLYMAYVAYLVVKRMKSSSKK